MKRKAEDECGVGGSEQQKLNTWDSKESSTLGSWWRGKNEEIGSEANKKQKKPRNKQVDVKVCRQWNIHGVSVFPHPKESRLCFASENERNKNDNLKKSQLQTMVLNNIIWANIMQSHFIVFTKSSKTAIWRTLCLYTYFPPKTSATF